MASDNKVLKYTSCKEHEAEPVPQCLHWLKSVSQNSLYRYIMFHGYRIKLIDIHVGLHAMATKRV